MPDSLDSLRRYWRHQRVQVVLRLLLVVGFAAAFALAGRVESWNWIVRLTAVGGLALSAVSLVRYVERTPREVLRFLEGIRYDDFSGSISSGDQGGLHARLAAAFEEVSGAFRRLRAEREEQAQYLQTVVRHVGVALLAWRGDGRVTLFNAAARRLLDVPGLGTIEALRRVDEHLAETIETLEPGRRALVRLRRGDRLLDLVVFATTFVLGGEHHTLVSFQDIRPELEEKESEAWQQLTRVLTHEIMNSIAPITSLAGTAQSALASDDLHARATVREALATIERRGRGLVGFVEAYRSLTRVPPPQMRLIPVRPLFDGVLNLLRTSAAAQGMDLRAEVAPESLEVAADPELLEQALINLVLNAIQAKEEGSGGRVTLRAAAGPTGRAVLRVEDDGPGILPEALDRIFVPFFTTRAGGSGIGLSLARQIMRRHGGTITAHSEPGEGTTVSLHF